MGNFKVTKITDLETLGINDEVPESDYSIITEKKFIQMKYMNSPEEKRRADITVKAGLFHIQKDMLGLFLEEMTFTKDKIIEDLIDTKEVEAAVDCFIHNIPIYKEEFGIEVPRRAALIYGPAGCGKSSSLQRVCNKYVPDGKTAVIVWHTSKFEAYEVKDFAQTFKYEGVDKLILVAEDLGGVEAEDSRMDSDNSLLSLLDNNEKTFTIPTFILATTNFAATFLANIADRPGRFDDKIFVDYPNSETRKRLLTFFSKGTADKDSLDYIGSEACKELSNAHIKEVYIRSRLRSTSILEAAKKVVKEHSQYAKGFRAGGGSIGLGRDDE
jgi:SpoVK/Ycf46/Vps4 family AAA+-type ATPase